MQIYKKLSVWRKAHELTLRVYSATSPFVGQRHAALASQMRRAAASIAANIAEGSGRVTNAHFALHLAHALASARELDYHLLLSRDLGLIESTDHAMLEARTDEVCRMLVALRRTVAKRQKGAEDEMTRGREDERRQKTRGRQDEKTRTPAP